MILKASQRAGASQLAAHLLNDRDNDHVRVHELRSFAAADLHGAFQEAYAISRGTKCRQYLFSVSFNPPKGASPSEQDFERAINKAEERLGLTGQPRAIVFHEKEGRRYAHTVWSRIDADEMRAVNMAHFKRKLTTLSRELYLDHDWPLPEGLRSQGGRSPLNFTLAEWQQAKRQGRDPCHVTEFKSARFNPLDWLEPGDPDITENAMLLADALVVPDGKGESFWAEEAKSLLSGLILYVATDEREAGTRHLGRVRDLLMLDGEDTPALFQRMTESAHHVVASTGARSLQKDPKLLSNVLASAQAQTNFLDSPRLRENLSASDFKFEDLKTRKTTIYLVLPADRLDTFGRWLRLLIQQAITVNARNIETKPDKPILFLLDEMPALGKLTDG